MGDLGGGGAGYPGESKGRRNWGRFWKRPESGLRQEEEEESLGMDMGERRGFLPGSGSAGGDGEREFDVGTSKTW